MLVREILGTKGQNVVTVEPTATVLEAARVLDKHNIGAVVVQDSEGVVGILSERDILRLASNQPSLLESTLVGAVMTRDLVVGVPDDKIPYAMAVMTNNRVRHLPILDDGRLVGIVSIGDLVNVSLDTLKAENRWLRDYVQGGG